MIRSVTRREQCVRKNSCQNTQVFGAGSRSGLSFLQKRSRSTTWPYCTHPAFHPLFFRLRARSRLRLADQENGSAFVIVTTAGTRVLGTRNTGTLYFRPFGSVLSPRWAGNSCQPIFIEVIISIRMPDTVPHHPFEITLCDSHTQLDIYEAPA